jgi:hypothetical protein
MFLQPLRSRGLDLQEAQGKTDRSPQSHTYKGSRGT